METFELPDLSNPVQVMEAITTLLTLHNPPTSAKKLRDITGLANRHTRILLPLTSCQFLDEIFEG